MNLKGIVGDVMVWDFGFRYNLPIMDLDELKVIMVKYEIELKRSAEGSDRFREVTEILGKIYREIMKRKMLKRLGEWEAGERGSEKARECEFLNTRL